MSKPNTKHTPGPWQVDKDYNHCAQITDTDGNLIAECPKHGAGIVTDGNDAPWHHADANARLIAAAPDLLAACKFALSQTTNKITQGVLQDAIAKAEGNTP